MQTAPAIDARPWLLRHLPALSWWGRYPRGVFVADLLAGLTVATVAVPQAMAYAALAGVRPEIGLYTAIVVTAVGALLDSSRLLINGPTNAISISLLSALAIVPASERLPAATLLAFLVGAIQIGIALMRLGDLTRYVSYSVIVGFTVGAGALLVLDQMKNLLGMRAWGGATDYFLKRFWLTMTRGGHVNWMTLLIGAGSIAIALALRQLNAARLRRGARFPIPQHLVAISIMATLVWALRLDLRFGVRIVGAIPAALPHFRLPQFRLDHIRLLSGDALAIALLGLLEALAMAKALAFRSGHGLDVNQQCLSEGVANLAGSFFQCIPGSGSLTRSAVNEQAGAVSQWSGVFCAIAVAAMVVLFGPLARFIPESSLAGILMLAAFRMIDRRNLVFHFRATQFDAGIILITAAAAVFVSIEFCIVIGVLLSFVLYLPRVARLRMTQLTRTPEGRLRALPEGAPHRKRGLLFGLEGELFFGSEPEFRSHLDTIERSAGPETQAVLLVLNRARNPDATFLSALGSFQARLSRRNLSLYVCGVQSDLERALKATGLDVQIGRERISGRMLEGIPGIIDDAVPLFGK